MFKPSPAILNGGFDSYELIGIWFSQKYETRTSKVIYHLHDLCREDVMPQADVAEVVDPQDVTYPANMLLSTPVDGWDLGSADRVSQVVNAGCTDTTSPTAAASRPGRRCPSPFFSIRFWCFLTMERRPALE